MTDKHPDEFVCLLCYDDPANIKEAADKGGGEPIYQYKRADGSWIDQTKTSYDYNIKYGVSNVRIVYASHQPQAADKAGVEVKRGTCNQFLQVQSSEENLTVWAIPKTRQFSWEQQDERYWIKMVPEYRCVQQAVSVSVPDDVMKDAQRYRWLRWCDLDEMAKEYWIGTDVPSGADFDAAIDAAMLKEGK